MVRIDWTLLYHITSAFNSLEIIYQPEVFSCMLLRVNMLILAKSKKNIEPTNCFFQLIVSIHS